MQLAEFINNINVVPGQLCEIKLINVLKKDFDSSIYDTISYQYYYVQVRE